MRGLGGDAGGAATVEICRVIMTVVAPPSKRMVVAMSAVFVLVQAIRASVPLMSVAVDVVMAAPLASAAVVILRVKPDGAVWMAWLVRAVPRKAAEVMMPLRAKSARSLSRARS